MSDIIDQANDTAELFLDAALRKQQQGGSLAIQKGVGMCLNCSEDLHDDRRWCGPECRNEWQARHR